jgi:hypothetical protein
VTFVTAGVASLMLDSTCFVLGSSLGTFILAQVLVKCHFEVFVALSKGSEIFCRNRILRFVKPDSPILIDLFRCFFFWIVNYIMAFSLQAKHILWDKLLCLLESFIWSFFLLGHSDEKCPNVEHSKHSTWAFFWIPVLLTFW